MYRKLVFTALLGFAVMYLFITIVGGQYSGIMGIYLGFATFGIMSEILNVTPKEFSKIHLWLLIIQLIITATLAPWFGWTNEQGDLWGRHFFTMYLVLPLVFELVRNKLR